jgi:hypothetical protein
VHRPAPRARVESTWGLTGGPPWPNDEDAPPTGDRASEAPDADQADADSGVRSSMSFRSYDGAPHWPAPLAPEALHGLAGDVVRTIDPATEADSAALLLQFLTAFGNVIGRNAHLCIEADLHFMNLFVVLVGETSKARKGTSWGRVRGLFISADQDWTATRIESGLSSGEGLIWAVRDAIRKMEKQPGAKGETPQYVEVIADHGVRDKRLLVFEPEFSTTLRMLERQGNALSGVIRQAWDTGRLNTLVKHAAATATDAHISIVGHTTRAELLRYLNRTEIADGFANRFVFACIQRSKYLPRGGALSDAALAPLAERLKGAIDAARRVQQLTMSDAAWLIWDRIYSVLSAPRPGLLGAAIARAEAQVRRLAGVYALLDGTATVAPVHLLAAVAVWDFSEQSACYVFSDTRGDPVADEILRALRGAGSAGLTRTQIRDLFGRNKAADDIGRALGVLLEHQLARMVADRDTGGRPAERWAATAPGSTTKTTETTESPPGDRVSSFKSFRSYLELAREVAAEGSNDAAVEAAAPEEAPGDPPPVGRKPKAAAAEEWEEL